MNGWAWALMTFVVALLSVVKCAPSILWPSATKLIMYLPAGRLIVPPFAKSAWSPLVTTGLESGTRPWKPVVGLYGPGAAFVEPERWRIDVHRQLLSVEFGPEG